MLFQSIGARYSLGDALGHMFTIGSSKDSQKLKNELSKHYKGEVALFRKGRAALSEAVRIATGGSGYVAVNGFTCYSVIEAVEAAGCTPVYIDIDRDSLNFSAKKLETAFKQNSDIKAVVVQNSLGIPCDIKAIEQVASNNRALLIEDLAHAVGATYDDGQEVGTIGDITMMSLGRDKTLDTVNGGVLIVRRAELIVQMRQPQDRASFINQLRDRIYPIIAWKTRVLAPIGLGRYISYVSLKTRMVVRSADGGINVREAMPHWLAKRALDEIDHLKEVNQQRRKLLSLYDVHIGDKIVTGAKRPGAVPIRVPLFVENRQAVLAKLKQADYFVEDVWYDRPVSPARLYGKVNFPEADCPVSVEVARTIMNLPTHSGVRPQHILEMTKIINEVEA